MASFLLIAVFLSPLWVAAVTAILVASSKEPKPRLGSLVVYSLSLGAIGAISSLLYTLVSIEQYQTQTRYDAGNGPLGWLFFYGPLSFAAGQIVALVFWWVKKTNVANA